MSDYVNFIHAVRYSLKQKIGHDTLVECYHSCPGILKVLGKKQTPNISEKNNSDCLQFCIQ